MTSSTSPAAGSPGTKLRTASTAGRPAPIFMFGFERSGTTLLSMMVGSHPEIAVPFSTTGMWYRYWRRLESYGWLKRQADLERLVTDVLADERVRLWDVDIHVEDILGDPKLGSYSDIAARFHTVYAKKCGKERWGNIDIATLDDMDIANAMFPDARFIHIVRDGRDVALSHETYPYGARNTFECAKAWRFRVYANLKMGAIVGPERYYLVRYEDLVSETELTLGAICNFLGVLYAPEMLEYPNLVRKRVPNSKRFLWPLLDQPPDTRRVCRWKTEMSETKRIVFERTAGRTLRELGYEVYPEVPKRLSSYLYEVTCILGISHRMRRIARRLGLARKSV